MNNAKAAGFKYVDGSMLKQPSQQSSKQHYFVKLYIKFHFFINMNPTHDIDSTNVERDNRPIDDQWYLTISTPPEYSNTQLWSYFIVILLSFSNINRQRCTLHIQFEKN